MTTEHNHLVIQVSLLVPGPIEKLTRLSPLSATTSTPGHTIREVWLAGRGLEIDGTEYARITIDIAQTPVRRS